MFVVGLTGGIGSGKSAASDRFEQLDITIVDADIVSRVVVEIGTPALAQISEHFGSDILLADGNLDRAALRTRIFNTPEDKTWLEALLHPLIGEELFRQLEAASSPYVLFVSPLLVESKQDVICDQLLVIDVPEEVQVERTIHRDNNDEAQVRRIIASQASRQERLQKATQVIENTAAVEELTAQVDRLHQQYLDLAKQKDEG